MLVLGDSPFLLADRAAVLKVGHILIPNSDEFTFHKVS